MKKNNKRMLVAVLAMAMALSMTACSQEPGDEPSSSEPESSVSEQASEPEPSDPEVEEEPGSDAEAEAETETSEPAAEEPSSGADTGSSAASQPATDTTTSQPAANQSGSQAGASGQAPAAQTQQPAANSQSQAPASQNQSQSTSTPPATQASSGKGPLAKYTVNVTDPDTPATHVVGTTINGKDAYYFYSSSDKIVGNIPMDYIAQIIRENGLSYAELDEQKAWFVENFNIYRGLDGGEYESSSGSSGSTSSSSSNDVDIEAFCEEVIRLTNEEREDAGLEPVVADDTAMEYAQIRAEELSVKFSHTRPNNESKIVGGLSFMENAARGQTSPEAVVNSWMNSDGHRATLLGDYSDYGNRIGVGCYQDDSGTLYWIQEFVLWDANA